MWIAIWKHRTKFIGTYVTSVSLVATFITMPTKLQAALTGIGGLLTLWIGFYNSVNKKDVEEKDGEEKK